ncbi:MAG: dienelactone hydrolase family protein [Anaerolineae bacterium]|nr:dienelactone hydrolase family protein [Anaerolineae bacterium]MBL8105234.1 dienelactone hydrolase family protein [Anaerolineales bacterium]MCC7187659.1 dienelactone hydrolase family protein [Anaerolineales bacterium]
MNRRSYLFCFLLLTACQPSQPPPTRTLPPPHVVIEAITPVPLPTDTPLPSPTPTIEEIIYPYTIEGLRQHEYQSGEVRILETLTETDKYTAYLIDYPSDGLTITGVMQIPKGEGPFPVIVMNHGFYARSIYTSGDGTDRSSVFLAERGYITLASDYRSWGGSDVGESLFYSGLAIDVINLLNAIPSIPQADATRVGMWGHSMGGGVTMKVLTILGGRVAPSDSEGRIETTVKAAVLYSSVSADHADVIARWGNGCLGDIAAGEQLLGCNSADVVPLELPNSLLNAFHNAPSDSELMKSVSPIFHLDSIDAPIQIHYGSNDGLVYSGTPPEWSIKLDQALRDAGKDVELFRYEGEGHSFVGQPWFDFMIRVVDFFDEYVKSG